MTTPDPDLFPHATAQAPELIRAKANLGRARAVYAGTDDKDGSLWLAVEQARERVTQLEAEAMRKEGR